jgi:crotonobetainyl-CoA:carnitine CoA-transferase CaiB-like acyl-CoA transferase
MLLKSTRILDFGRYIAGPLCASMLADLGAEVIRIDKPGGSEDRYVAPVTDGGEGALYLQLNRNKLGITLDPQKPEGREIVRRLLESADAVVANLPEATMIQMGIDYESLRAIRPDIVLVGVSAFGSEGPYAERTAFDGIGQAMSGSTFMSGYPGSPVKAYASWVDYSTGMIAAFGALAALAHRERTGEGQLVSTNLLRAALTVFHFNNLESFLTGKRRQPSGNRSQFGAPADLFATADGHVVLQVVGQPLFRRWARLVGREDMLNDPRFATDSSRAAHGELLSEITQAWCREKTTKELLSILEQNRIPAGPLLGPLDVFNDLHVKTTGMLECVDYPGLSEGAPLIGSPATYGRFDTSIKKRAPTLGEHTHQILTSLGYADSEVEDFRARGVI